MGVGSEPIWEVQWHSWGGGKVRRFYLTRKRLRYLRAFAAVALVFVLAVVGALPVGVRGYFARFTVKTAKQENRRLKQAREKLVEQARELSGELSARLNRAWRLGWMTGVSLDPPSSLPEDGAPIDTTVAWLSGESQKLLQLAEKLTVAPGAPCALANLPTGMPLDLRQAVPVGLFGLRVSPFTGREEPHLGLTLAAPAGTRVLAAGNGRVAFAGTPRERKTNLWSRFGTLVVLDHGGGVFSLYGHLGNVLVKPGQWVTRSQPVGTVGTSGWTRVSALYFEVRWPIGGESQPVDPLLVQLAFPLPQLAERLADPSAGLAANAVPLDTLFGAPRR
ncbi:MAG: M23 family metallopeptidase [Thermoanaerobaculum sp.]